MVPELTAGPRADLGVETRECVPALLGFDHVPVLPTGAGGQDARVNVVDHVSCAEAAGVGTPRLAKTKRTRLLEAGLGSNLLVYRIGAAGVALRCGGCRG